VNLQVRARQSMREAKHDNSQRWRLWVASVSGKCQQATYWEVSCCAFRQERWVCSGSRQVERWPTEAIDDLQRQVRIVEARESRRVRARHDMTCEWGWGNAGEEALVRETTHRGDWWFTETSVNRWGKRVKTSEGEAWHASEGKSWHVSEGEAMQEKRG
jgi:hypothetical protein